MRFPTVSTPTSHWRRIIHQRFSHLFKKNNSGFLPSLFCHTKPLQGETLSLSSVNASERGVWMCWLNRKPAEILIKRYMSLGPGSVLIACRLHYSCSLCLILPLWRTALFHKEREECMCIYTYFSARSECSKGKERWMVLFTRDAQVNSHAGEKLHLFTASLYIQPNSQIICLYPKKPLILVATWGHFKQCGDTLAGLATSKHFLKVKALF